MIDNLAVIIGRHITMYDFGFCKDGEISRTVINFVYPLELQLHLFYQYNFHGEI